MCRWKNIFSAQTLKIRGIIIYDAKYGVTEQCASYIAGEVGLLTMFFENVTTEEFHSSDFIVLGSQYILAN